MIGRLRSFPSRAIARLALVGAQSLLRYAKGNAP